MSTDMDSPTKDQELNPSSEVSTILSCRGYTIKKKVLSQSDINDIHKYLTVKPKETPFTCIYVDKSFHLFQEDAVNIRVPRFWGI